MLQAKPRSTLIQRLDGSTVLIGPKSERVEFSVRSSLQEALAEAERLGWAIAVEHVHG